MLTETNFDWDYLLEKYYDRFFQPARDAILHKELDIKAPEVTIHNYLRNVARAFG